MGSASEKSAENCFLMTHANNPHQVARIVGFNTVLSRFITDFGHVTAPLTAMNGKGSGIKKWDSEFQVSFYMLKYLLVFSTIMVQPLEWLKPFTYGKDITRSVRPE